MLTELLIDDDDVGNTVAPNGVAVGRSFRPLAPLEPVSSTTMDIVGPPALMLDEISIGDGGGVSVVLVIVERFR